MLDFILYTDDTNISLQTWKYWYDVQNIQCLFRWIKYMASSKQISTKYTEISTKYLGDLCWLSDHLERWHCVYLDKLS